MVVHHWRLRDRGLATTARHQRGRRGGDWRRHHRRRGLEVHRGRLGPDGGHPDAGVGVLVDPPALPERRRRPRVPARHAAPRDRAHGRRARRRADPLRRVGVARVRQVPPTAVPACVARLVRRRAGRADAGDIWADVRVRHSRSTSCRPRTESSRGPSWNSSRSSTSGGTTTSSPSVVPEFVVHHWWDQLLHNQSALLLKGRLLFRKGTVVTSIPSHVD